MHTATPHSETANTIDWCVGSQSLVCWQPMDWSIGWRGNENNVTVPTTVPITWRHCFYLDMSITEIPVRRYRCCLHVQGVGQFKETLVTFVSSWVSSRTAFNEKLIPLCWFRL